MAGCNATFIQLERLKAPPKKYFCYGMLFGVEAPKPGHTKYRCVGYAKYRAPFVLDKVGFFDTREAAQAALDGWARRQGLKPTTPSANASTPSKRRGI